MKQAVSAATLLHLYLSTVCDLVFHLLAIETDQIVVISAENVQKRKYF